ncbi:Phosphoribosylamine--glycine ligase [Candidatus Nitrosocaldus cavascurensis]|uniref:Phosphoribosylamine--glycine ligase n=2 Tax=Candidatus Nitrosocaldaceae TaxID=1968910 RepID=A0A2K5ASL8_9ARCH|nr:Phosphoribosylamine--glycine ligase [Candidatus Nitrosocaldus cavascurensis]
MLYHCGGVKMNVLVLGSGAREHAIGWKVANSSKVEKVFFAPGNGGTRLAGYENLGIGIKEHDRLLRFAMEHECLTIVGPEEPLAMGIVDLFKGNGLRILGPSRDAARLESSKVWAKEFMKRHGIPTAEFKVFDEPEAAKDYIARSKRDDVVVKADGLAAGKGVVVCSSKAEAYNAVDMIMKDRVFGDAGNRIVLEERLYGEEVSFICMSDGKRIIPLATSQDHKRVYDNDEGPNTGGMGAYSPNPIIDGKMHEWIMRNIMQKAIDGLRHDGVEFKGFLYAGLMLVGDKAYVLEFNVRLGDPETQVILPRLRSDLIYYVEHCIDGTLDQAEDMVWDERVAVCVVLASKGYPNAYETGKVITGLDDLNSMYSNGDHLVFHAGTKVTDDGRIVTDGGRVLSIVALGSDMKEAIEKVYSAVNRVHWEGMHYRRDIGKRALRYLLNR